MFDFKEIVENVPDYKTFLTVDEMDESSKKLAEEYPDIVQLTTAGYSRKNHPIYCLKIGSGKKNAFLFGCPHPNEPIGAMCVEYLSRALAENKEFLEKSDYTWYMIKSIDVDGTKLNEGWFKGPFTLTNYTRNYFRPAGYEQAEWTFPIDYKNYKFDKPIPETQVLMDIIKDVKPDFMYSLHNAGFGGTYWYISKEMKELWNPFYEATKKRGIPLHLGEPEVNYIEPFSQAIYPMITTRDSYDYEEKYGSLPPEETLTSGDSSCGYTMTLGLDTVTLVTELPYFSEPRIQSDKEMPFTRREAAMKQLEASKEKSEQIRAIYEPISDCFSDDNPFIKMVEISLRYEKESYDMRKKFINENEEYSEICKESQAFDNLEVPKFYALFSWTLLRRGCEFELGKEDVKCKDKLEEAMGKAEARFEAQAIIAERDLKYEVNPIKEMIQVQLESGLLVASELQKG